MAAESTPPARGLAAPAERLRISTKIFYGVGEIAITVPMVLFGLFTLFFYNSVMKLPAVLVGIGTAAGLVLDALIDPYIGFRSDNCVSRLGRRHAYMLIGSLTMGFSFWLLMIPPQSLGTGGLFLWLLGSTLLLRLTCALYRIPYLSLGAELSQDYHDRTAVVGVRSFCGLCGTMAAASLPFVLFFPHSVGGIDPKLNYSSYPSIGLAFGSLMTFTALLAVAGTFNCRFNSFQRVPTGAALGLKKFINGFAVALRNHAFRSLWLSFSLFFLAVVMSSVVSIHYFTWYIRISDGGVISKVQSCFYLGALVGVLVWVGMAKYVEKRSLYLGSILVTAGLMFAATILFGEGRLFGTGNPAPLFAGNALAGLFVSALWVLPSSMLADVTDLDELHTGQRREGIFFGLLNFGEKIAAGLSLLISGALLDYFVRLAPGGLQNPMATFRIGLLYGALPAILLLISALLVLSYRLDRRKILGIQTELRQCREVFSPPSEGPVLSRLGATGVVSRGEDKLE